MSHTSFDQQVPFESAVQLGLVPGWSVVRIVGHNNDIDAGTEDLWIAGGIKTFPTAAGAVTIVSTSANDAAAGTGAQTVLVEGLDANYNPISELLTTNGVSNVVGVQLFLRINKAVVINVGSVGANDGIISGTIGGNTQFAIGAGFGATAMSHYTVRAGYTFLTQLYEVTCGRLSSSDLEVNAYVRTYDASSTNNYRSWEIVSSVDMSEGTTIQAAPRGRLVPQFSDIRVQGVSTGANLATSATFVGFLIDNNYLIQSR